MEIPEPCRTVVLTAVLAGLRIGEILALQTRSSERVIPMSSALRQVLGSHRTTSTWREPEDLVFCTDKRTPLSPKNLYNRALAPTCDELGLPRISWHSFRHTNGIGEVGESVKTVQALLGHSDLAPVYELFQACFGAS